LWTTTAGRRRQAAVAGATAGSGGSDDAIDALEDYFHEWSASHTDMIRADPAVEADPDRSGAPLTNGPGQTANGNQSAGLQFDWFQAAARGFMNASANPVVPRASSLQARLLLTKGLLSIGRTQSGGARSMAPHGDRTAGSSDNPATNTGGISASGFASDPIYIMMGGTNVGYAVIISTTTFHFTIAAGFSAWN